MKTSEDLFDLIHSMNSHEKGYFRKYSSLHVRGEKNIYMQLFEAISKQQKYDEEKLKKRFHNELFIKQLPVAKNYLYNQVLKALRSYHYSIHSEIMDMRHNAEILIEKSLYDQAHKALKKAKQTAKENELLWAAPEIAAMWEMKLAVANNDMNQVKNIISEKSKDFLLLQNAEQYRDINFKMYMLYAAIGKVRGKEHLGEMKKIMNLSEMKNESSACSFEARLRFLITHALWADVQGNADNYYSYSKKVIDLFKLNPKIIPANLSQYIAYYGNVIGAAMNSRRYREARVYLNELKELSAFTKNDMLRNKLFYFNSHLTLYYFNTIGQSPGKTDVISDITKKITDHHGYLNDIQKSILYSNLATTFFIRQQYHKCTFWLNCIRNEVSLNNYPNIQSYLRIFYLLVNYEAGKTDLLPYLIQSVYRFLKKKEQLYKFETLLLHFLRNELPKVNPETSSGKKELILAFQKLKNKITPLAKEPYEKNAFEYFDYVTWLDSKIQNCPFAEMLKEKAKLH
ncbi:MAG: hypothetical protein HY841_04860 [Bacteroidetes bacterium]|nr:hypothetical protein [Bacteroidota bacterium]